MFARIRDCLYRNRGRIAAVGAAIGAAVAVRELLAWRYQLAEEAAAEEQRAAVRHEQLFQSNQQTCASAEEKLVPHIAERFETLMDIRTLQEQLRDQQSDRLTLWYQLKLCSFARTVSSVYALSILGTYIHLQLHLVGGHLLRDLAAPDSPNLVTADVQHTYLSLVEHFLQHGLESLVGLIHPIVEKVVGALVLTENLGPATVHELFKQIRQLVDAKPEILKEALRAPLPDQPPPALVALVTESLELCEHPLFLLSIRESTDILLDMVTRRISEHFAEGELKPVAKLLPIVNAQAEFLLTCPDNSALPFVNSSQTMRQFSREAYERGINERNEQ
eukprot:m.183574 g.183574  ORF g.183574 m.183574 type:complete len:334 (+) comp10496_c0_seq9:2984-3985(+)